MVQLKIDHKEIEAAQGANLLDAIREAGIDVPSMCHMKDLPHFTSCMLCVVKDLKSGKLIPSCSLNVEEGMDIVTGDDEILEARKTSLELLLSEHVGDCEAPCQLSCPAHMDIPLMNRLLAEGKFREAYETVMKDIALPSILGRICPAPCEGACRRKSIDEPVSICLLKRYAGDFALSGEESGEVKPAKSSGKKVAIIGAGPAGLATAWHLQLQGYSCTIIDSKPQAGGSLAEETTRDELPPDILQSEVDRIVAVGVEFIIETRVDQVQFAKLQKSYDAIVVAAGEASMEELVPGNKLLVDKKTYRLGETAIFVVGSALKKARMAVRALGQGKEAAFSVDQFLKGERVRGEPRMFNSRFGKLHPVEFAEYLKESNDDKRYQPLVPEKGFSEEEVRKEATRCLHCDCRDLQNCKLRLYADEYGANQRKYSSGERLMCTKDIHHNLVIYEASKCIKCGLCVRITEKHRESLGLTFIGRGFDVRIDIPFNNDLSEGLQKVALEVAEACPTGAISKK